MSSDLYVLGIKLNTVQPRIVHNVIKKRIMTEFLTEGGPFWGIVHNLLGVAIYYKVQINNDVSSEYTDGEIG